MLKPLQKEVPPELSTRVMFALPTLVGLVETPKLIPLDEEYGEELVNGEG